MIAHLDSPHMPAQNTTESAPATPSEEGVMAMAVFESRKGRGTMRAWGELSEIDRAVLLESVRQRRRIQPQRQVYTELFGVRTNR